MKRRELNSKLKGIRRHVKRKGLIKKCIALVEKHGKGGIEKYAFPNYGGAKYKFSGNGLSIDYNNAMSELDGGYLRVEAKDKVVFELSRKDGKKNKDYLQLKNFNILRYIPGAWEKDIVRLLAVKSEKSEKPLDALVPEEVLRDMKDRFKIS